MNTSLAGSALLLLAAFAGFPACAAPGGGHVAPAPVAHPAITHAAPVAFAAFKQSAPAAGGVPSQSRHPWHEEFHTPAPPGEKGRVAGFSEGARPRWTGGTWHGGYWPPATRGAGFVWFLPVLPLGYAVYWYAGLPYYYVNNAYYEWDSVQVGYVSVDPPPIWNASEVPPVGAQWVFMYPLSGQSSAQQQSDRQACDDWAAAQQPNPLTAEAYRRAMIACATARGYSAN
jgi:hypothetical protein